MKIEQYFFPLTVVASVIAVYIALRDRSNSAVPSVQANPNYQTAAPAIVTQQSTPATSTVNTNIAPVQPIIPGSPQQNQGTNPQYVANAAVHRWANNPNNPNNPNLSNGPIYPTILTGAVPANQTYNLPPALSFSKRAAASATVLPAGQAQVSNPPAASGGCSGGCGGCGGCGGTSSNNTRAVPYFPGGDTPVVAGAAYQQRDLGKTQQNLAGYAERHGPAAFGHFPWAAAGASGPSSGSTTENGAH